VGCRGDAAVRRTRDQPSTLRSARAVTEADAIDAAARLLASVEDLFEDEEAACAVGTLYLRCHTATMGGDDGIHLRTAAWCFLPAVVHGAAHVPESVTRYYQRTAATDLPGAGPPDARGFGVRDCHDRMVTAVGLGGSGPQGSDVLYPAVFVFRYVTATVAAGDPLCAAYLSNLSGALHSLYRRGGDTRMLDEAVAAAREAVGTASSTDAPTCIPDDRLAAWLMNLAGALHARFGHTGDLRDLEDSTDASRRAVALACVPAADQACNLSNLALALHSSYELTGNEDTLGEAVARAREAVALAPEGPQAALPLSNLAVVLGSLGARTRDIGTMRESIDAARSAVRCDDSGSPESKASALGLAQSLLDLHLATQDSDALRECVQVCRASLESMAPQHPERFRHLLTLGRALRALALPAADPVGLREAVSLMQEAVAGTPVGHSSRPHTLGNLVLVLQSLYDTTSDPALLDAAVDAARLAREATPEGHPLLLKILPNLANSLLDRFRRAGNQADLLEAVGIGRLALAKIPPHHPDEPAYLTSLAYQLYVLYQVTGDPSVLEESIEKSRRAADRTDAGHPRPVALLTNLSIALVARFERTGSMSDLDESISLQREAVNRTPPNSTELGGLLSNLLNGLRTRYDATGDRDALEEAVNGARCVVSNSTRGPEYPLRMANAAATLHEWSELTHDDTAAEDAVVAAREAVAAIPGCHMARVALLSNLCGILLAAYRRTGDLARLDEAERSARDAAANVHPKDPDKPLYLLNLSMALRARHERDGAIDILQEGLRTTEDALSLARPGHPLRPRLLSQLGLALRARYERTGELRHLIEAVDTARDAAAACDPAHPDYAMYQSNLSGTLQLLSQRHDAPEATQAISEAVAAARSAVASTEPGHRDFPALQSHLCGALMLQHRATGGHRELAAAVAAGRRAVAASPPSHPGVTNHLANLTAALRLMFQENASRKTLRKAVHTARRAVDSLPQKHPSEAAVLVGSAAMLRTAYEVTRRRELIDEALRYLDRAANSTICPVMDRTRAARALGRGAMEAGYHQRALTAYENAVDLLEQLAPWRLLRGDREFGLGELNGLGSEAAAAALTCDRPGRAVELLEQARGVLLNQTFDMRGETDDLRVADPGLADEFENLRAGRDAADHISLDEQFDQESVSADGGPGTPLQQVAADRARMDVEWQALLARIRALPGLGDFLGRPALLTLQKQAARGPVIMLTASQYRSDALILTADPDLPVLVVPLPQVTENDVTQRAERLLTGRLPGSVPVTSYAQAKRRMADLVDLLSWQWDQVAEPVLREIGLTQSVRTDKDESSWPRIWWCPVGVMAFLPWHASGRDPLSGGGTQNGAEEGIDDAGPGTAATGASVMDRAVSSWTPTIRALAYARRPHRASSPEDGQRALLVEMPIANGTRSLRKVVSEAERIAGLLAHVTRLGGPDATPDSVLDALRGHQLAHFACHAVSEWESPGLGGLLLGGGEAARLTVNTISQSHIMDAELAFLSACSTTLSNQRLADESVHIAAGFMLCGYRHVIGTLWPVDDTAASEIAVDFYTCLTNAGASRPRAERSAFALHFAARQARAKRPWAPSHWAAHLHEGA
jgi:tetratricopeptide (TPR) repeat protein